VAFALSDVASRLFHELRQVALLRSTLGLLGWDEQTLMPVGGAEHRANQSAQLAGLAHERATRPEIGDLLAQLTDVKELGDAESPVAANVREARRKYERARKLDQSLVEELTRCATMSQQTWVAAKKAKDFKQFLPWLDKTIRLKREEAQAVGAASGVLYDALLDDYEPGALTSDIQRVFDSLRKELVPLVAAIRDSRKRPDETSLTRSYPVPAQSEFAARAAAAIGFDMQCGRIDISAHPFCSGIGPGDCRLTTRYDEHHFPGAFFGVLHEAGHGIYEQGLDPAEFGLACGEAASLGIHESQSRMWENLVGRSRAFWEHFYRPAQLAFPAALGSTSLDDFHFAINNVQPSWIRVEADEVTYNLHIMLRFDLEQALISGDLKPADVPTAWNERFQEYFGMTPPNDALGCLQDVHWSAGLLGYFPTYALGNMYASQFFEQAKTELGDLSMMFARGEFQPLKQWLNENIHRHGMRYRASVLVEKVTGRPLSAEPLLTHLRSRFAPLFGV
jgi:carboxypeptidase Taq